MRLAMSCNPAGPYRPRQNVTPINPVTKASGRPMASNSSIEPNIKTVIHSMLIVLASRLRRPCHQRSPLQQASRARSPIVLAARADPSDVARQMHERLEGHYDRGNQKERFQIGGDGPVQRGAARLTRGERERGLLIRGVAEKDAEDEREQ